MALGTALAIGLGSAVLGAGASVIGANKNSNAIDAATQASSDSNAQSVALQREIYNQNQSALSPFMQRGNAAGDTMNALLGLSGQDNSQPQQGYYSGPDPSAGPWRGQFEGGQPTQNALQEAAQYNSLNPSQYANRGDYALAYQQAQQPQNALAGPQVPASNWGNSDHTSSPQNAQSAFDVFRNSTGYQFRLGEGMNALNSGYAGGGMIQSGAAMKAAQEYGQNFASNEFGNYMGYLGNQQGVGLSGASALAGVGQGYANNISNLNSQNANNITAGAVAGANNTNAMIGGITSGLGNIAGIFSEMERA